jgi:hypothetical protein
VPVNPRLINRLCLLVCPATLLIFTSCSDGKKGGAAVATTNAPISIEPKLAVGKVHSGMTTSEVIAALGEPQRKTGNALEYTKLGFAVIPGRDGHVQAVMCGDVTGINGPLVKTFTGRTAEGIGMNSTRDELVKAYGPPDDSQRFAGGTESLHYISRGMTFTLEGGKVHHIIVRFSSAVPDRTIQLEPPPDASKK